MKRARKGFTLVEILIVVVILGILAAIVIPQFSQASTDAKLSSLQSNLQSIRSAIALYKIQHNDTIPADGDKLAEALCTKTDIGGGAVDAGETAYGPYLQVKVPLNPFTGDNKIGNAPEGNDWIYIPQADGSWTFDVGAGAHGESADYVGKY